MLRRVCESLGAAKLVVALGLLMALCSCKESVGQLVADAEAFRVAGKLPEAAMKVTAALEQEPKNIPARILSARIHLELGLGNAALGILLRARADGADERGIAALRAEAELSAHRFEDVIRDTATPPPGLLDGTRANMLALRAAAFAAIDDKAGSRSALEEALAVDPHSVDVRLIGAKLAIDDVDFDGARREIALAKGEAPSDRRVRRIEGDLAYAARDFPTAARIFRGILDAEPWNDVTRGELAAIEIAQDNLSAAIALLDPIVADPNLPNVLKHPLLNYLRAVVAYRQTDYAVAQSNSAQVVTWAPGFEPARLMAGASSYALHAYEQAYYYLSPYVAVRPDDLQARKLLAMTQLQLGGAADAVKSLVPFADKAGEDPELLSLLATAAARSGDAAGAEKYLKLALDQHPDNLRLRAQLGLAEIARGDPRSAIDDLQRTTAATTDSPDSSGQQVLFIALMQTRQYEEARGVAEHLVKTQPNQPLGHILAAAVYLTEKKMEPARTELLKARQIEPGNLDANTGLARLAIADDKLDEARAAYQAMISAHPQDNKAYLGIADLDVRAGRPGDAETMLGNGLQANPEDPTMELSLLRLQLAQGKAKETLAGAVDALKKRPNDAALTEILGQAQLAIGEIDAAMSTFKDLVNAVPQATAGHIGLAESYLAKYTPANPEWSAINEATEAVALDPHDMGAKRVLARALIMHDRFDEASKVIDELKAADPNEVGVIELVGLLARTQGKTVDAAAAFERAITIQDNALDRGRLAELQTRIGHFDKAAATLLAWLEKHPDDKPTRNLLATVYFKAGRMLDAADQYGELLKQEPTDAVAQNNLAWISLQLDRTDEALNHARKAVALAPTSKDNLDTLGTILLHRGEAGEAVGPLEQAWNIANGTPPIGLHLSQALAASGKSAEALTVLRQVLSGESGFAERAQAEQLLHQLGR